MMRRVFVLTPHLAGTGGIQCYSKFLVRALARAIPGAVVETFSPVAESMTLRRKISFICSVAAATAFRRPDLIIVTHAHFAPLARALSWWSGAPYWVCAHGYEVWSPKNRMVRSSLFGAKKILAVSDYTKSRLLDEADRPVESIRLLPNTFDEERFFPAARSVTLLEKLGIDPSAKIVLTVARLDSSERYKGYDRIIRLLPDIRTQIPEVHYLLVGEGDDRERVESLIRDCGVGRCVTLAGRVPDAELPQYYNVCELFAMPSTGEGFGIVFLEALACGKPVVAGNKDGSTTALMNGALGSLVDPDDDRQLAGALVAGLSRSPMPADPAKEVSVRFGFESFCSRLQEITQE